MISAKKAYAIANSGNNHHTHFMKWASKQVKRAAKEGSTSVKLELRPHFHFPGQYEIQHLLSKNYDLDWDEQQSWIEISWHKVI